MEQQGNQLTVEQALNALHNASDIKNYQIFAVALENNAFGPVEGKKAYRLHKATFGKVDKIAAMLMRGIIENDILLAYLKTFLTDEEMLNALKEHAKKGKE